MQAFKEYLKKARAFNTPRPRALVLGNTSADMDSCLGSAVMSWMYGELSPVNELLYSPVINCKKSELPWRLEIVKHFEKFGLDKAFVEEVFYFSEDIQTEAQLEASDGKTIESIGMIDFNKLNPDAAFLADRVHLIIDHHMDSELYNDTTKVRDIKKLCSAVALLIDHMDAKHIDDELAQFMCAPLALDSGNFKEELKDHKWIPEDMEKYKKLQEISTVDLGIIWEQLDAYKHDVEGALALGMTNLLVKNYKTFEFNNDIVAGVSSWRVPVATLLNHFTPEVFANEVLDLMKTKKLTYWMAITTFYVEDRAINKNLMLFVDKSVANEAAKLDDLEKALEADQSYNLLDKKEVPCGGDHLRMITWQLGNITQDRKKL